MNSLSSHTLSLWRSKGRKAVQYRGPDLQFCHLSGKVAKVLSDGCEPILAFRKMPEPMPTKVGAPRESGGTFELEIVSAVERALLVEIVANGGMNGGEFLQPSHAAEPPHGLFSLSKRQV